jgi:hypothetical protein
LGEGLTANKMAECVWVSLEFVAQIEYVNSTEADHSPRVTHAVFVFRSVTITFTIPKSDPHRADCI